MSFPWCTALQEWFGFPTQLQLLTEDLLLGLAFSTGCRKISALVPEAPLLPPSSLTLVSVGLFTYFSSLSQLMHNILNYIIMEWSSLWIMGSVLSSFGAFQRWLEPAVSNMSSPRLPLTEATPSSFCATKPLPCQPNTMSSTAKDNTTAKQQDFAESCVTFYRLSHSAFLDLLRKASEKLQWQWQQQ